MYVPSAFRVDDEETLRAFMADNAFATLVTTAAGELHATHLPFVVDREGDATLLRAHMARANPQWRLLDGQDALVIFRGPHAYVTPRWYETRNNVPTWDYMAVHVYGQARVVEDRARTLDLLTTLSERYERGAENPWRIDDIDPAKLDGFLQAIVAFDIKVSRIDASFKLSQNKTPQERRNVAEGLEREGYVELASRIRERG
jgi:transcriptional regulator